MNGLSMFKQHGSGGHGNSFQQTESPETLVDTGIQDTLRLSRWRSTWDFSFATSPLARPGCFAKLVGKARIRRPHGLMAVQLKHFFDTAGLPAASHISNDGGRTTSGA